MNLKKILEKNGFSVKRIDKKYWDISRYTPEGEDWNFDVYTLKDFLRYAKFFDPEEEFEMWMEARKRGRDDIPRPSRLWQDQLWKQEILDKVIEESED